MKTIQTLWQSIETQYNNGTFPDDKLEKIDVLVYSDDIENIRNGLTLMTTIAPEYLCRYLKLDDESVVLRGADKFSAPISAERVLVESAKGESMWQGVYESAAFESMEFRAVGDVAIEDLSESEKAFCVRMAKEMVRVPAGDFMMGALDDDEEAYDYEKPRHKVILTQDFLIGKYAVTQALWESVMGSNPSIFDFKGANRPVENVSWFDVVEFCNKLSELEGLTSAYAINGEEVTCDWSANGYRLPTEAEWEYAARANQDFEYAGSDNVDEVAWDDDLLETHPVGQKKPNGFGLYDMSGNVSEWVWDWWVDHYGIYFDQSFIDFIGERVDPTGISHTSQGDRVTKGSGRVYERGGWNPLASDSRFGFRFTRTLSK